MNSLILNALVVGDKHVSEPSQIIANLERGCERSVNVSVDRIAVD